MGAPRTLRAPITQTQSNARTSRVGLGLAAGSGGAELSARWCDSLWGSLHPLSSEHPTPELVQPKLSRYPTGSAQTKAEQRPGFWPWSRGGSKPRAGRGYNCAAPPPQAPPAVGTPIAPALHPPVVFQRLREAADSWGRPRAAESADLGLNSDETLSGANLGKLI